MDITKIDLEKPAFGEGSQKLEEPTPEETPAEDSQPKEEKEEEPKPSVEEQKVPYSRFRNVNQAKIEAERRAEETERLAEDLQARLDAIKPAETEEPPDYWKELYGDSDASKKAWKTQQRMNEDIRRDARRDALEAVKAERTEEVTRVSENLNTLDEHLEEVAAVAGRDLTDQEQSSVLDIIDEFTPKDEEGNYMGAILSPDKAWEIYNLKNEVAKLPKKEARNAVASLSGSQTQGEPGEGEKDKNFNPFDWNAWKKKV